MSETLNDLIERGVTIREKRIAEERARLTTEERARERGRAEDARLILDLLPPPLAKFAHVDPFSQHAFVRVSRIFPRSGSVKIYAQKDRLGSWSLVSYEATNPDGYYLKLQTLEEAVAYAAGALEI